MRTKTTLAAACVALSVTLTGCSTSYFDHLHKGPDFIASETEDPNAEDTTVDPTANAPQPDGGLIPEEGAIIPPKDAWDECPYLNTCLLYTSDAADE